VYQVPATASPGCRAKRRVPRRDAPHRVGGVPGEVVWLLTQSAQHKQAFFLGDLEWMVIPPIILQQFPLLLRQGPADRRDPVGLRRRRGGGAPALRGDKLWIVEACPGPRSGMVAPFGGTDEMLKDLKAKVFPDREMRFRAVEGAKGVARVM
jgi:cytolysin-activating lysine-acyltransferase